MIRLRKQIAILLVAVLVLTGHSMAIARGMPTASGVMELCTGSGPVMIAVDAEGNPTGHTHICPEFSLSLMDAVAPVPALAVPVETRGQKITSVHDVSLGVIRAVEASARAPPRAS
ncbi:hypothetical protein [uncultured Shimia sp.]|uniref:hypothetical protein n=1 Tax=uncultured Shimia sp. TaxID=573152 RepID=UPI00260DBF0D|nr:hypothetical protein [uncultured Shimia sp.]